MQQEQKVEENEDKKHVNGGDKEKKKNKQKDLKYLQKKIDIIKDGEIKAKQKYFMENRREVDYDAFYDNQYQNFRNPSLNGWRTSVKQVINDVDERMNTDKYFIQFLTSVGRVFMQKLIEDAIEIKQSGELDEKVFLTEDHVREAYRKLKNSNNDINYSVTKQLFN